MKALILLLAALVTQAQPAFTITISAGQTVVAARSSIEVQVTLKNTSNHGKPSVYTVQVTRTDTSGGTAYGPIVKSNPLKIAVIE